LSGTESLHGGGRGFPLIAAVGEDPLDEREQPPHSFEDEQTAVAILVPAFGATSLKARAYRSPP
jgi:hypothetical protein